MANLIPTTTFEPSAFFMLRTALLPFNAYLDWSADLTAPTCLDDLPALKSALTKDRDRLRERLHVWIMRPEIREAIFLASPDLNIAVGHWLNDPSNEKHHQVELSLVRYFSRMCGRATPFGLFAGCSTIRPGERTRLVTEGQASYRRHTRLDMDYLCSLTQGLANLEEIQNGLLFYPNSSSYSISNKIRYAELRLKRLTRSYHLVAVNTSNYLLQVLSRAEVGATPMELAACLTNDLVSFDQAITFIRELINNQLLVPNIQPAVTGCEPIHSIISLLEQHPASAAAIPSKLLAIVRSEMESIDASPLGIEAIRYQDIANRLSDLPAKVELSRLFQVDMVKPSSAATLGESIRKELFLAIELMQRFNGIPALDQLAHFRSAFELRYGEREIPLCEALDPESGVGFGDSGKADGSPLLEGIVFPRTESDQMVVSHLTFQRHIQKRLHRLLRSNGHVLELNDEDVQVCGSKVRATLPDSFAIICQIAAESQAAIDSGDFQILLSPTYGPSGANLLGRFCHGDEELTREVQAYLRKEEAIFPDAIFAEVVHMPEGRTGNVILRPVLRNYEIPFLGRSGIPEDHQIPITDLLVSVRQGKVVIRSKKFGREVFPRVTCAYRFGDHSLNLYRFLGTLQNQGTNEVVPPWWWGSLSSSPFLPRVTFGRLVLAVAMWFVEQKELKHILAAEGEEQFRRFQAWRLERNLPRFVLLAESDNKLVIDLDNILSIEAFLKVIKNVNPIYLEEFYPGPEKLCAEGPEGRFVHQIVVPFTRQCEPLATKYTQNLDPGSSIQRSFIPGSEWLYCKIYTGYVTMDQVLRDYVSPIVSKMQEAGLIDGWFFVRYGDPDWHLRLRFHGEGSRLLAGVLPTLHATFNPLLVDGRVTKIQIDTYEREIERYGDGKAMLLAEHIFQADSEAAIGILRAFNGRISPESRWQLCLRGMDQFLDDLGFDFAAKAALVDEMRRSFASEFRMNGQHQHQIGNIFRSRRQTLERLLDRNLDSLSPLAEGLAVLAHRSERLKDLELTLTEDIPSKRALAASAPNFLHMQANRILRGSARANEMVIYDHLSRIYESHRARARKRKHTD